MINDVRKGMARYSKARTSRLPPIASAHCVNEKRFLGAWHDFATYKSVGTRGPKDENW